MSMTGRFIIEDTSLAGLKVVQRTRIGDDRGYLSRLFCDEALSPAGWTDPIRQINLTSTRALATVRGMHFQHVPSAEMKLVTCIRGEVFDVAVDIRPSSSTFLRWHGELLSADNDRALLIPQGFAHGFQALSADVELIYCHSEPYTPIHEGGLRPTDPALAIVWPMEPAGMSQRDSSHPLIDDDFSGVGI